MSKKLTPMMRQFNALKEKYADTILLFRLGDFYEMFGEDARVASQILHIQLTKRSKQENAPVMCGIPQRSFEAYVNKLSRAGVKVAICEQIGNPQDTAANEIVERQVTQVITPGTTLSRDILEADKNNFICLLWFSLKQKQLAISICDMTTGEMEVCQISFQNGLTQLKEIIARYQPNELLFPEEQNESETLFITELINQLYPNKDQPFIDKIALHHITLKQSIAKITSQFQLQNVDTLGFNGFPLLHFAVSGMLEYLEYSQKTLLSHLQTPKLCNFTDTLILDSTTIKHLELLQDSSGSTQYSLIKLINKTATSMGQRLLRRWLLAPLANLEKIQARQKAITSFLEFPIETTQLHQALQKLGDIERDITRLTLPSFKLVDFASLRSSLAALQDVVPLLLFFQNPALSQITQKLDPLTDIYSLLENAFVSDLTMKKQDGKFIRPSYHTKIKELNYLLTNSTDFILQFEKEQKQKTGISSLKVKEHRVFGLYIEVSKTMLHKVPDTYIRKQTLANSERFTIQELQEKEELLLSARDELLALETLLLEEIQAQIHKHILRIQQIAKQLAYLDCLCSLSLLAYQENYTCPQFGKELHITEGKHPILATKTDINFVSNDTYMSKESQFILLLTGPNMGGKSTYMRQVALLCLMAQIGSFIPAKAATLPLIDRLFTRVGASDNIAGGQSTFMVEMSEAAMILQNATPKSLVILDELGRGTSTGDGISLAWAIVEKLQKDRIFTLFATHYHELTHLQDTLEGIQNISVSVLEENNEISFLHKIITGSISKSYGIHVAKLAGIPKDVLIRATHLLQQIETKTQITDQSQFTVDSDIKQNQQIDLFNSEEQETLLQIQKEIKQIDLNNITPLQAVSFLAKIQKIL